MDTYDLNQVTTMPRAAVRETAAYQWIQSARFDLLFFILSPLIALPVMFYSLSTPSYLGLVVGVMLGVPHYLSTFTFFLWEENRDRTREKWMVYFGVPLIIATSVGFAVVFRIPAIVQIVVYVWNAWHVARQSCGIMSIYRQRAGVKDPSLKPIVNAAILSTSFALAFWNVQYYSTLNRVMTLFWKDLPYWFWLVASCIAAVCIARLAVSLVDRAKKGEPAQTPELLFLGTSLLLFHPYIWVPSGDNATLGMLLGHFVQYLGIVWLVHYRKYGEARRDPAAPQPTVALSWLMKVSASLPLMLIVILGTGLTFVGLRLAAMTAPATHTLYEGAFLALSLVHFYLDGVFWAFKRPDVRKTLGPYVLGRPAGAPSVARTTN